MEEAFKIIVKGTKQTIMSNRKEYDKKYYQKHKEHLQDYQRKWKSENSEYSKRWNEQRKIKLLIVVSDNNLYCIRCGCNNVRLLEINHKNGGGHKELQGGKMKHKFYQGILDGTRKVDDLELLCRVCNARHYLELKFGKLPYEISYNKTEKEEI